MFFGAEKGKPVRRKTVGLHRGRRLIVTLEAGDVIGLRQERCKAVEYVPVAALYDMAVKWRVSAENAAKRKAKA